jgi:hypothetical protein
MVAGSSPAQGAIPFTCSKQAKRGEAVKQISGSAGTKVLERTSPIEQTVEVEPGHWRNRWAVPTRHEHLARQQGALPLGDGTWLGYRRFESSELAEQHASRFAEYNRRHFDIGYLGTEFFPEY